MNYQLVAFDMDGTLLSSDKRVLPSSVEAIGEAARAGRAVAVCTGRCAKMIELDRESLPGVRYAICVSGASLYDLLERRVLSAAALDPAVIAASLDALGDEDAMIDAFTGTGFLCEEAALGRMERYGMEVYESLYRATGTYVDDVRKEMLRPDATYQKFIFHLTSPEARARVRERCRDLPLELADSEVASLEFSPRGVDKGTGLLALADLLGIPHEATMAVGDADNDLPMLRAAGLAVAMGNANENARAAADVVVADNDSGGCAEAIRRFLLGEEAAR